MKSALRKCDFCNQKNERRLSPPKSLQTALGNRFFSMKFVPGNLPCTAGTRLPPPLSPNFFLQNKIYPTPIRIWPKVVAEKNRFFAKIGTAPVMKIGKIEKRK